MSDLDMTKADPTAKVHALMELTSLERRADKLIAENSFPFQSFRIWFLEDRTVIAKANCLRIVADECVVLIFFRHYVCIINLLHYIADTFLNNFWL